MRTAIHVDFTPNVSATLKDDDDTFQFGLLDDFHRVRRRKQTRTAGRQTVPFRIIFRLIQRVVVVPRCSPWLERHPGLGRSAAPLTAAPAAATLTAANLTAAGT